MKLLILILLMIFTNFVYAMGASCGIMARDEDDSLCLNNVRCAQSMSVLKRPTAIYFLVSRDIKRPAFKPKPLRPTTDQVTALMDSLLGQPVCVFGHWNKEDQLIATVNLQMQSKDIQAMPESRRTFSDPEAGGNDIDGPYEREPGDLDHLENR